MVAHDEEVPTDTELYHFSTGPFYDPPEPPNSTRDWNKQKPRDILEVECASDEIETRDM